MDVKGDMGDGDLFHQEAYGLSVGGDGTVKLSDTVSLRGGVSVGYSRIYDRSHIRDDDYRYPALEWKHQNVLFISPEIEGIMTVSDFSLRTGGAFCQLLSGHQEHGISAHGQEVISPGWHTRSGICSRWPDGREILLSAIIQGDFMVPVIVMTWDSVW
ncbi:hypothetical protein [Escherichia coli]|uniref:hypothetical protein n=1 Tax=Escherichia coli TaxID=562 RepID=UPI0030F47D65